MDLRKEKKREVDLSEYLGVIFKRKWVLYSFAGTLILFTGILTFTATPVYQATTTLLIEEEPSKILRIEDEFRYRSQIEDLRFFQTQLKLLESKSLAERVTRKMNLLSRPEFGAGKKPKKGLMTFVKNFLSFRWIAPRKKSKSSNPEVAETTYPSSPYSGIAQAIRDEINISPIRDTKLVNVSYTSPYPILAADIVNTLAEEFINFSIEKRYEATQQASDFLSEQIANLREDLAAKERELQRYGEEKDLFFLNPVESTVISQFADLIKAYTRAEIERIEAEATYRELKELDVDSLPQFMKNLLLQQLKTDYTRIKNEYEEKRKKFKPGYPEMIQLKAKLDSMREELRNEIKKAVDEAEREYRTAKKMEASIKNSIDAHRADVVRTDSNAILYNSLKIEVENKRILLNYLGERQNETLVSARLGGLKTSNITIIDKAEVPKNPISPNKKLNLILALIVGIFGGVSLCFLMESLDNTVKGPEDVEKLTGLPSLGIIPYLPPEGMKKKKRYGYYSKYKKKYLYSSEDENPKSEENLPEIKEIELINHVHPKFFISEDYRTVRTSILLSHAEAPPKTIAFSSTLPKEGKTATLANMAVAFSQLEEKVLAIDSDLRRPRLHRIFKVKNVGGLSGFLTGKVPLEDVIKKTDIENIWLIPSGPIPPNPAELLNSKKMIKLIEEVKKKFDKVLLDSPPVLAVVDAVIISSLVDSTVVIIEAGETTRKPFLRGVEELKRAKVKIIGVMFNEVKARGEGYYSPYYHYYRHRSHYYEQEEKEEQ